MRETPGPASGSFADPFSPWAWGVLLALLGLLALGVLTFDRSQWPAFVGDEATYLMQAQSLAFDWDLRYGREDFDRFVRLWDQLPEGLILQSGDGGASITYGKPFFYPLWLAPFVRLAPVQGVFVANLVLLVLVSLYVARVLQEQLGPAAPLCVAAWVFASVAFAYTFWAHPDLFLMCLTALALGLAFGGAPPGHAGGGGIWRWAAVGALVAVVVFSRPLYAPLLLPVLLAVPWQRRRTLVPALLAGAVALFAVTTAVHQSLAGSWTGYGGERRGFYSYTGFPEVDLGVEEWGASIQEWGDASWIEPRRVLREKRVIPSVWAWNSLYYLAGQNVGLLPYFLPLLLGFVGRPRGVARWSLLAAVALCVVGFFFLRSHNFYGGGGAIANRYFLPLYPALWFLASRPMSLAWPAGISAAAALFVGNLWLAPRAFPVTPEGTYRYITPVAQRLLPFETTQSHLKPSGREDVVHHGLWVKFLDRGVSAGPGDETLLLRPGTRGELLLGSPRPLSTLDLEVARHGGSHLALSGGELRPLGETEGARRFRVELGRPRARHSMWWTWDPVYLYKLGLEVERWEGETGEIPFSLRPVS